MPSVILDGSQLCYCPCGMPSVWFVAACVLPPSLLSPFLPLAFLTWASHSAPFVLLPLWRALCVVSFRMRFMAAVGTLKRMTSVSTRPFHGLRLSSTHIPPVLFLTAQNLASSHRVCMRSAACVCGGGILSRACGCFCRSSRGGGTRGRGCGATCAVLSAQFRFRSL